MPSERLEDKIRELDVLIGDNRVAMLTTIAIDGKLVSRPLYTRDRPFDGELWFFVGIDDDNVNELLNTPQVNIAYAAPARNQYISIAGEARIERDHALIAELWDGRHDRLYFTQGKDDPRLALLQIRAQTAEVWEGSAPSRSLDLNPVGPTKDSSRRSERRQVDVGRH